VDWGNNCAIKNSMYFVVIEDSFNNEVMSIYFLGEKKKPDTTITNYEYDKTGNWIKFNKNRVREISHIGSGD
jgi:hypothetical protein